MSVLKSLSVLNCDPALGGGSLLNRKEFSELMDYVDEGRCDGEFIAMLAENHRSPTPAEWAALREPVEDEQQQESEEPDEEEEETPEPPVASGAEAPATQPEPSGGGDDNPDSPV